MEYLERAIRDTVPAKIEANVDAARKAYEMKYSFVQNSPPQRASFTDGTL